MTFRPRAARLSGKLMLLALAPIVGLAGMVLMATPAQAAPMDCNGSGWDCYWVDNNYAPTGSGWVANFQGGNSDWSDYVNPNLYCAYNWDNCASSAKSHIASDMTLWNNHNCGGSSLTIISGDFYSNLGTYSFNDAASSDSVNSNC